MDYIVYKTKEGKLTFDQTDHYVVTFKTVSDEQANLILAEIQRIHNNIKKIVLKNEQ